MIKKKSEYKILFFHWEIRFLKCALRCGRLVDLLRFYIVIDRNLDFFVKMSDNARNSSFNVVVLQTQLLRNS